MWRVGAMSCGGWYWLGRWTRKVGLGLRARCHQVLAVDQPQLRPAVAGAAPLRHPLGLHRATHIMRSA